MATSGLLQLCAFDSLQISAQILTVTGQQKTTTTAAEAAAGACRQKTEDRRQTNMCKPLLSSLTIHLWLASPLPPLSTLSFFSLHSLHYCSYLASPLFSLLSSSFFWPSCLATFWTCRHDLAKVKLGTTTTTTTLQHTRDLVPVAAENLLSLPLSAPYPPLCAARPCLSHAECRLVFYAYFVAIRAACFAAYLWLK